MNNMRYYKMLNFLKKVIDKPLFIRYTVKVRYKKWLGDALKFSAFFIGKLPCMSQTFGAY